SAPLPAVREHGRHLLLDDQAIGHRGFPRRCVLGCVRVVRLERATVPVGAGAALRAAGHRDRGAAARGTLMHLDKFHKDSLFGWFWIVAYIAVPPALGLALWVQHRAPRVEEPPRVPLAPALRALLVLEGLVLAGVGASLFAAPHTADSLWPWPLTPLTARATGAFL